MGGGGGGGGGGGHVGDVVILKLCTLLYYSCTIIERISWVSLLVYFSSAGKVCSNCYPPLVSSRMVECL